MAAIGETQAREIIKSARAAGIDDATLEAMAGTQIAHLANLSGARAHALADKIEAHQHRARLIDEAIRIALLGNPTRDERVMRTNAAKLPDWQLDKMIRDGKAALQRKGVDTRTEAEKAAADAAERARLDRPASSRQVDYIMSLLARRARSGEGGGFFTGPTDRAGVAKLTQGEATLYIRSLSGDY